MMGKINLTFKEFIVFALAYKTQLDENGNILDTKKNNRYVNAARRIAGGSDEKLDEMCNCIRNKMRAAGIL